MKKLVWCSLIVACVVVVGCSAPSTEDAASVPDPEVTSSEAAGDEAVMEEGFESGETGSLEPKESVPDDESGNSH